MGRGEPREPLLRLVKTMDACIGHKIKYLVFFSNMIFALAVVFLAIILAVSNVLTALIFSNSRNFETEGDTTRKLKPN